MFFTNLEVSKKLKEIGFKTKNFHDVCWGKFVDDTKNAYHLTYICNGYKYKIKCHCERTHNLKEDYILAYNLDTLIRFMLSNKFCRRGLVLPEHEWSSLPDFILQCSLKRFYPEYETHGYHFYGLADYIKHDDRNIITSPGKAGRLIIKLHELGLINL